MAFWGVQVKPGSPVSLKSDAKCRRRLHISQATLAPGSWTETSLVQCNIGDCSPVLLCALLPNKTESLHLNLEFDENEEVIFSVLGPRGVYLTGFFTGDARTDDQSESYGEDIANSQNEESVEQSDEDEYESSFIDDDGNDDREVFPPCPGDDDDVFKQRNKTNTNRRLKKRSQVVESDDESISWKQNTGSCIRSVTTPKKKGKGVANEVQILEADASDHSNPCHKSKKSEAKTIDIAVGQDLIGTNEIDVDPGTNKRSNLLPSPELGLESVAKPKEKRKRRSKERKIPEANTDMDQDLPEGKEIVIRQSNKTETGFSAGPTVEEGSDKPKKKRRKREQQGTPAVNDLVVPERKANENTSEKAAEKKKQKSKVQKNDENMDVTVSLNVEKENSINDVQDGNVISGSSQVRTLSNGLVIEDLESSKSDGIAAALGRKLKVRYTAKLKENGEIIDSNGKAPYRFRLGDEDVMEGWKIGLEGMRAGDKRRLIVPPSLGNGSRGTAENVPPDSWVIYDVKLLSVH